MEIQIIDKNRELYVDSRTVASGFGIEHKHLCETLSKHFSRLKPLKCSDGGKGRPSLSYALSERQVMIVPALCRPTLKTAKFQEDLVDAFLEARKRLGEPANMPTHAEALEGWAAEIRKSERLQSQIEADAPKLAAYDKLANSEGLFPINSAAKMLGWPPKKFFAWLRDFGYLQSRPGYWNIPYQRWIDQGLFAIREGTYTRGERELIYVKPMLTQKGVDRLTKINPPKPQ